MKTRGVLNRNFVILIVCVSAILVFSSLSKHSYYEHLVAMPEEEEEPCGFNIPLQIRSIKHLDFGDTIFAKGNDVLVLETVYKNEYNHINPCFKLIDNHGNVWLLYKKMNKGFYIIERFKSTE